MLRSSGTQIVARSTITEPAPTSRHSACGVPQSGDEPRPPHRRRDVDERPAARLPLLVGTGADQSGRHRRRRRFLDVGLRRQPLPGLQLAADQRQPRAPAPDARRRDPGSGRPDLHRWPDPRRCGTQRGGTSDRRGRARGPREGVLHQRWCGGDRERDAHGAPAHRPPEGPLHVPQLPRRDVRLDRRDGRPAAVAVGAVGARDRPLHGSVPVPVVVPRHDRGRGVRARRSPTSTRS